MKTRSNMPLFVVACSNVKQLTDEQINMLRCGDYLVKRDASGEHAYKVTFKSATGMCITYHDAYCVETQSYDLVDGHWVYNSEDKTIIAEPQIENIVDKDGHQRFIEGNLELQEISGVTFTYAKWSLSGSHLMIVLAGSVANGTTFAGGKWSDVSLPQWVIDKIFTTFSSVVVAKSITAYANDWSTQNFTISLRKPANNRITLTEESTPTFNADRNFRIEFDLLVDNE